MKTKRGISLVVLIITIIVMTIIVGITIVQVGGGLNITYKSEFVYELSVIKDRIKEYYMLVGRLPVKEAEEYTADEIIARVENAQKQDLLANEIQINKDQSNKFFIIDLSLIDTTESKRGISQQDNDIYLVASNTLNVYYLEGVKLDDIYRFSLAMLVDKNETADNDEQESTNTTLNNEIQLLKNKETWTNEITITVSAHVLEGQILYYSFDGINNHVVPSKMDITINSNNMTDSEKETFNANKKLTVSKMENDVVLETKDMYIYNLDITAPTLGAMEMVDTSNEEYNIIRINSIDKGGSDINCLYYDYDIRLENNTLQPYYAERSSVNANYLLSFGKISLDGNIYLNKDIKSISVLAVDNATNVSEIKTYTIDDSYLVSQ